MHVIVTATHEKPLTTPIAIIEADPTEPELTEEERKFINRIKTLPDPRDNRGKRHTLSFVIIGIIFALLSERSQVSGIHRYIKNKIQWLREVTGEEKALPISRAHLPRLLAGLDWDDLGLIIAACFGKQITQSIKGEWLAVDGKALRGSQEEAGDKQAIVHAVSHDSRLDVAQARMVGDKASEITVVREFLKTTGLDKQKLTLDAHHCNPETTAQIQGADGSYLIQVKENQPILLEQCRQLAENAGLRVAEHRSVDPGHGRITLRQAQLFPMASVPLDPRWQDSGIRTLIVLHRETFNTATQKESADTSYYISSRAVGNANDGEELAVAVRRHWGVESGNWILDTTLNEDNVRVGDGNQAQIMGKLRSFAANILRWSGAKNFREKIEEFIDSPDTLVSTLRELNFL
jgi:predicted transposase YbfD/YdcC